MPALAVPGQTQPDTDGSKHAASSPAMKAADSNGPSAVHEQTEAQPTKSMHLGSFAGKAALALEGSERPQEESPADSSNCPQHESRQAHVHSQVNGQHSLAEQETKEHSPDELRPGTAGMDEHANGIASLQYSGSQELQEAKAALPAEDEQSPKSSMIEKLGRANSAEVENGQPDRHGHESDKQAAESGRGSDKTGSVAALPAAEREQSRANADTQISNADSTSGNGLQTLQQAEGVAALSGHPNTIAIAAESILAGPDSTQAAEQQGPPQDPAHATPSEEGLVKTAPTHGEPEHMNVSEDTNVIEEVSDKESSEDENVTFHDLPCLIPECFSEPEDGDSGAEDEVFTFPAGMTELELRGGLHPVRISLPSNAGFSYSVQDEFDDNQPLEGKEATADVPAAAQPPESSMPEKDRASQAAAAPDKDGDGQIGHEEPQKPHSMTQTKDSPKEAPLLARCALRPGVAREDQCDKSADAFAIREGQRYLKVTCTEGCTITYHFTCWRRLERVYRVEHPEFSWKSKEGVQCFTNGCTGQVKLAQELEEEAGIDTHRRELLRLPDQAKKPERPPLAQEQLEQRRGRKKGPVQRAPEPEPVVQQERAADRPAAVPANTNVDDKQEPLPKPDRVPALGPFLLPRQDNDDEDLERLAAGLKGKKEKKKREKKKEKEVILIGGPDQDTQHPSFFEELERERRATPTLDTATFPRMVSADDAPDLAIGDDPLWDLLISMKSGKSQDPITTTCGTPAEHLLIWHIDTQSLARRGVSASDELHRLLSSHGRIANLEVYLRLSAAAVSFLRTQDAQKALFKVDGHQLERKKLQGCFLQEFPGDQDVLTQKLRDSLPQPPPAAPASAAAPTDQAAEMRALMARESQNLPTNEHSVSGESVPASQISLTALSQGGAPAEQPILSRAGSRSSGTRSPTRQDRVEMLSVQLGAEYLGLQPRAVPNVPSLSRQAPALPRPQANLNAAAREFCPGVLLQDAAVQGAAFGAGLASAASQTSLSSADGTAASWPMQPSQLDAAGRATSMRSDASSIYRAESAAYEPLPPPPLGPVPHTLPGLDQVSVIQIAGCTNETLATFRQFQADGGFAIPTTDLGQVNPLLDANCTGLLLYENESQMLHGLWKSTQIVESGTERVMEFEAHMDMDPLQGRLLLGVLQTHSTGDLRLPQAARGTRLEALKPLLRPEGSSEPPTPDPGAVKLALGLNPDSKPFSPLAASGRSTPNSAAAAAASTQRSTTATITEVAQRITPRSHSEAAQQTLPSKGILRQAVTGTVLSRQAGEAFTDENDNSGSRTAGGSTGIGEATESQVQRQLGFTVHAEGLHASVTPFAKDPPDKLLGESSRTEPEPQSGGEALKQLQGGNIPQKLKRPSPEVLVPPAMDAGGPSPERSIGRPLSGKATPEVGTGSTVSFTAQPSPVYALSSSGQAPVHAFQSPKPVQQSVAAPPAPTGVLTAGQQGQLRPPAGAAQQAGSAPQAVSPGRAQPHAQLPVPVGVSIQQHPPGALPGPAKQPADSAAPTVPAPAVPVRRVFLPRVPRPAGPSITTSQPGSSGDNQLSSVLSFLLPKETPQAAAAPSERPPTQGPQPARPQPAPHKAPQSPAGESTESAAAQSQLPDALAASGPGKGLPAPAPSPSRPQPAAKGEERSKQLSAGASEGASGSKAKSGSPQVLSLEALIAAKPKVTRKVARAGRSASPSNSQVSRESASPVRSSADMPLGLGSSTADDSAAAAQAAQGKKKRKQYAPLAVPVAAQPAKHAPRSAPIGPWASGPPAALVMGDSSRAHSGSEASPVPPLTPAAVATAPLVSQPQGPWAAGPPIAGGPADRSQRPQPTLVPAPAAAAEPSPVPRTQPKPEYRPPDVPLPSETLPWVFSSSHAGLEGASQSGSSSGTQPAPKPRAPAPGTTSGAQVAAASELAAAVGLVTAAAPARPPSLERRTHMCPLCATERAGHIVMTCKHFGPCGTCVPSADRLDLYPECAQCGGKVSALFRFFW